MSDLVATLEKLERMHRSLLELANKKTEFIKQNDIEQLDALIKSEQAHVAAIETLEKQRQQLALSIAKNKLATQIEPPTIAEIIDLVDEPDKLALTAMRERLVPLLAELKERNDLNQRLVFESLKFVNMSLNLMRPQQQGNSMNYSSGEVRGQGTVAKKTFYDSQA